MSGRSDFLLNNLSVYRQVVDFADPGSASYILPGGASGDPGSGNYSDQLDLWRTHQRIPMHREPEQAAANAPVSLVITPV